MAATAARTRTTTRRAPRKTAIEIVPGKTTFYATLADSRSLYTVMKKRGADTYDCEVKAHPEHGTQIDWLGHKKVFGGEEIRASISYDKALGNLFARADNFWATRKVGEIVHYHNGFGQYVRGIVEKTAKGLQMRPTALVGAWREHDLPKRGRDGQVRRGYHVEKILAGEHMSPNDSCMYEAKGFSAPMGPNAKVDPRTLPALDISDPAPLQGEEALAARYELLRMRLTGILGDGHADPKGALMTAHMLINTLLTETGDLK